MKTNRFLTILVCSAITCLQFVSCKKDQNALQASQSSQLLSAENTMADSLTKGLVGYYTFNGDVNDHSGHGNNVIFNNAKKTQGKSLKPNTAYLFGGDSSYMMVNNSTSLNPATITLYALVKVKGFYQGECHGNRIINKEISDYDNGRYVLGFDDQQYYNFQGCDAPVQPTFEKFYGDYGDGGSTSSGAEDSLDYINIGQWYNVAYTYNGSISKLYINGKLVKKTVMSTTFSPNDQPLLFGQTGNSEYPYWFNGAIDEIRIYNRALPQTQIQALNQ